MYKKVVITDKGADFITEGNNWVYENEAVSCDDDISNGEIVDVLNLKNKYLGSGFYSGESKVRVRLFSSNSNDVFNDEFFIRRVRFAIKYRLDVLESIGSCRVIFGEADGFPGLTVDKYNDILVSQITTVGLDMRKDIIFKALIDEFTKIGITINAIYERNDVSSRAKDGLELYKGYYYTSDSFDINTKETIISENGVKYYVDFIDGQKTGFFLDQKYNRELVGRIAKGKKVLDCFTHTGGFALNAALGEAKHVTAVDVSNTALEEGRANAKLNGLENVSFVQADVFDYLDTLKHHQFDFIILDPPAFTKSRRTVMKAYNGYKRINMQAMHVLRDGGYLATCSCSRYMECDLFEKMLREAAQEVGVTLKQISVTQQNADHPILWNMEESSYLKFYIFQIV